MEQVIEGGLRVGGPAGEGGSFGCGGGAWADALVTALGTCAMRAGKALGAGRRTACKGCVTWAAACWPPIFAWGMANGAWVVCCFVAW